MKRKDLLESPGMAPVGGTPGAGEEGSIEKVTVTDVTINNPDGTKTVAPTNLLQKDASGKLVLNKSNLNGANPAQQNPVKAGEKVSIVSK